MSVLLLLSSVDCQQQSLKLILLFMDSTMYQYHVVTIAEAFIFFRVLCGPLIMCGVV